MEKDERFSKSCFRHFTISRIAIPGYWEVFLPQAQPIRISIEAFKIRFVVTEFWLLLATLYTEGHISALKPQCHQVTPYTHGGGE